MCQVDRTTEIVHVTEKKGSGSQPRRSQHWVERDDRWILNIEGAGKNEVGIPAVEVYPTMNFEKKFIPWPLNVEHQTR